MPRDPAAVAAKNKKSRQEGKLFEAMIDRACDLYEAEGVAMITKVPEPRKVIGRTGGRTSAMICINDKKAHPDYMGSVSPDGHCIVFDAKHTDKDRMQRTALSEHQAEILEKHEQCGAKCFVVVSFSFEDFFMVPYDVWRDMRAVFGRQYIEQKDDALKPYRISSKIGADGERIVWFLPNIVKTSA